MEMNIWETRIRDLNRRTFTLAQNGVEMLIRVGRNDDQPAGSGTGRPVIHDGLLSDGHPLRLHPHR